MKIIILGAGQVGSSVAMNLIKEPKNDITIVDINPNCLSNLNDKYDLQTIVGSASHPSVLENAGARDADIIIAVTSSDEINMLACQITYTLFNTRTKIARVRNTEYLSVTKLFTKEALPVDVLISPEKLVIEHIARLINHPRALQVLEFSNKKVQVVVVRAKYSGPLVGHTTEAIGKYLPGFNCKIPILFRQNGQAVIPNKQTNIEPDDELCFIGSPKNIDQLLQSMRSTKRKINRIMLAGGGNISTGLAEKLEQSYQIKIIENDYARAQYVAEKLQDTIVLHGDATNEELLIEENIDETDIFCALTNTDAGNIITSMLAKRLGAHRVMAIIGRMGHVDLLQHNVIDVAISPQQTTIGSLLAHTRKGDIIAAYPLSKGSAEVIEVIAHGTKNSSKVVDHLISEILLPPQTCIGALIRNNEILLPNAETKILAEDHVIIFVADMQQLSEVENLFEVSRNSQ